MKHRIYIQYLSLFSGIILVVIGIIMAFQKLSDTGSIDIKSAVFSGKIETGSLGLLFCFLGVAVIIVVVRSKFKTDRQIHIKVADDDIDWSQSESGDPYWEIRETIFNEEKDPDGVEEITFCDWPDEKITEMVHNHLSKKMVTIAKSFLGYHDNRKKEKKERFSDYLINFLQNFIASKTNVDLKVKTSDISEFEENLINETFYHIDSIINWYFISKKRIFVGWDKYPNCYPPTHKEYENILIDCENNWTETMRKIKKALNAKTLFET